MLPKSLRISICAPVFFVAHLFAFEILVAYSRYMSVPLSLRSALWQRPTNAILILGSAAVRGLALFLVLALLLALIESAFAVRKRIVFYALIVLYILIFLGVQCPGIFDGLTLGSSSPLLSGLVIPPLPLAALILASVILLLFLNSSFMVSKNFSRARVLAVFLANLLLCFYLYGQLGFFPRLGSDSVAREMRSAPKFPHVFLFSLQALDPANLGDRAAREPSLKHLGKFLAESVAFSNMISPSTSSFEALAAILSTRNPADSGIQSNPPIVDPRDQGLFENSSLKHFKQLGYRIIFWSDDSSMSVLADKNIFEETRVQPSSLATLLSKPLLSSWVFISLFDNIVGHLVFPEMKVRNFFQARSGHGFIFQARQKIDEILSSSEPTLFIVHSKSISRPNLAGESVDALLAPLAKETKKSGSIVSVMSLSADLDEPDKFEEGKPTELSDPRKARGAFWLSLPDRPSATVSQLTGLVDVLPTLEDFALGSVSTQRTMSGVSLRRALDGENQDRPYYSETGAWSNLSDAKAPLAWRPLDFALTRDLFAPSSDLTSAVFLNPAYKTPLLLQKQRALFEGEFELIEKASWRGFEYLLCHRLNDPTCARNLAYEQTDRLKRMLGQLKEFIRDENGRALLALADLQVLAESSRPEGLNPHLKSIIEAENVDPWSKLLEANFALGTLGDFRTATKILNKITVDPTLPRQVLIAGREQLAKICAENLVFDKDFFPAFIATLDLEKRVQTYDTDLLQDLIDYGPCAKFAGQQNAARKSEALREDRDAFNKTRRSLNFLLPGQTASIDELVDFMQTATKREIAKAVLSNTRYRHLPSAIHALDRIESGEVPSHQKDDPIEAEFSNLSSDESPVAANGAYFEIELAWRSHESLRAAAAWLVDHLDQAINPITAVHRLNYFGHADWSSKRVRFSDFERLQGRMPDSIFPTNVHQEARAFIYSILRDRICETSDDICASVSSSTTAQRYPGAEIWRKVGALRETSLSLSDFEKLARGEVVSPFTRWLIMDRYHE